MPIRSISVVIPSFNRGSCLARCVESVLSQTLPPQQVILVDDGSADNTRELISGDYPDVEYCYQKNKGVSAARNCGYRLARGNWIAFLDSDDCWLPEKLEKQCQALDDSPDKLFCHTDEIWIRNGKRVNAMKKHAKADGWAFQQCLPLCAISPSSVLIHRQIFEQIGLFDENLPACEDYDLWLRICCKFEVLLVPELLLMKYGGHEDQLSRQYWGMDRFRVNALDSVLTTGDLCRADFEAARNMLAKKCRILINGALKRGKSKQAATYQNLLEQWQGECRNDC